MSTDPFADEVRRVFGEVKRIDPAKSDLRPWVAWRVYNGPVKSPRALPAKRKTR